MRRRKVIRCNYRVSRQARLVMWANLWVALTTLAIATLALIVNLDSAIISLHALTCEQRRAAIPFTYLLGRLANGDRCPIIPDSPPPITLLRI